MSTAATFRRPPRAVRRAHARVRNWAARATSEALRIGAGPAELQLLAATAEALLRRLVGPPPPAL
jgi:hypothetical protein